MLLVPSAALAADEEPICADRPGVATPTCTVPAGMVQVETAIVDWVHDRSGGARSDDFAIGETALKLGVTERLHVEVDVAPFQRQRFREDGERASASGFGDITLGAKYRMTSDNGPLQVAVKPFVKIPTAKRPLGNGELEGGLVVPVSFAIGGTPASITLDPEIDVNADGDGSGHHLATAQVISVGFPVASRLSASAELWGYWDFDREGTARQYGLAGSAAYLVGKDVQLDAGASVGLNRAAPDLELYAGFAFRF
jgi:hypothetical protein